MMAPRFWLRCEWKRPFASCWLKHAVFYVRFLPISHLKNRILLVPFRHGWIYKKAQAGLCLFLLGNCVIDWGILVIRIWLFIDHWSGNWGNWLWSYISSPLRSRTSWQEPKRWLQGMPTTSSSCQSTWKTRWSRPWRLLTVVVWSYRSNT